MHMEAVSLDQLKYPIGKFDYSHVVSFADLGSYIQTIVALPAKLSQLVANFTEAQLDTQYRPEGWTVRQVIHHLADSHANGFIRFKLALTENNPTIKPYIENLWTELADSKTAPIDISLTLLTALHQRWEILLKSMTQADFERKFFHPENQRTYPLRQVLALYAWHGEHHYTHIQSLAQRSGWDRKNE